MNITKFQNLKIIWTPGSSSAFPDNLSRDITIEDYQKHQLQHKRIPHDIEFLTNEHSNPVSYQIEHEDNPNDNCKRLLPNKVQTNEENILRLQNDGENFTNNSVHNEFPINSVQQASDCFRMG